MMYSGWQNSSSNINVSIPTHGAYISAVSISASTKASDTLKKKKNFIEDGKAGEDGM